MNVKLEISNTDIKISQPAVSPTSHLREREVFLFVGGSGPTCNIK